MRDSYHWAKRRGSQPRAAKIEVYVFAVKFEQANGQELPAEATTHESSRRAGLGVLKRTKNSQSSRADGGSMGPSALDRENGAV
jgi:hypothetical protein